MLPYKCYFLLKNLLNVHSMNQYKCSMSIILYGRRFISMKRGNYNTLTPFDIDFFHKVLEPKRVLQDSSDIESYNIDWLRSHKGTSCLVLRPKSTEEVSKILSYCRKKQLAVCPQGGNTGLVCGSIPIFDEIVVSMGLMNTIYGLDENTGILHCQAGCILENLENFANERNFTVPVDLGAKGSCQIGGNISTNAGGLRFLRYGSLHGNILGLKVVLPNGDILDCINTMRKNNTGYDLKHLFIGSEGTLGVVTEATILCYPKSPETAVAFLGCNSFDQVLSSAKVIKEKLHEVLSSLEMLDEQAADSVSENLMLTIPIDRHKFYILVEISGTDSSYIEKKLMDCLEHLIEQKHINNGTIATDSSHVKAVWSVRERITESLLKEGCGYKYDISLPLQDFYGIVEILRKKLDTMVTRCVAYGHLGDGNLHFNATTKEFDPEVLAQIEPFIYEWTSARKGSISAEHGIGSKKIDFLHMNKTPLEINTMRQLKNLFDPTGILNPYKVLPIQ